MAEFVLSGIGIGGISCAVPENKVDNTQFYDKFGIWNNGNKGFNN